MSKIVIDRFRATFIPKKCKIIPPSLVKFNEGLFKYHSLKIFNFGKRVDENTPKKTGGFWTFFDFPRISCSIKLGK